MFINIILNNNSNKIQSLRTTQEAQISVGRLWFIPLAWWLIWISVHASVLVLFQFPLEYSITDSLIYNSTLSILATGCFFTMRYTRPTAARIGYSLAGLAMVSWFWERLSSWLLYQVQPGGGSIPEMFLNSSVLRITIGWLILVLFMVLGWMFYYVQENLSEVRRAEEMRRLSSESELQAIRFQIHPHFLFNTLHSISALAGTDAKSAREMIGNFSEFLRGNLNKDLRKLVPFNEELNQLSKYFAIEKIRFGDRLQFVERIAPESRSLLVPPLILLPLAENAIKYGLYGIVETVTVSIETEFSDGFLIIRMSNPFESETTQTIAGTGFGLEALKRRMYLIFGIQDLVSTSSTGGTFTTTLRIPIGT